MSGQIDIKQALKKTDFLYIGIGSTQYSHTSDNPFTTEERAEIIKKALIKNKIPEDQFQIIPIPDIHSNPDWPEYVQSLVPSFDIVFVGDNGLVKELFETYTDIPIKIVNHEIDICATDIRNAIQNNQDWKKYLDNTTIEYLKKIDGIKRVKISEL